MEGTAVALLSAVIPFLLFTAGIVGGKAQDISAPVSAPIKNGRKVTVSLSSVVLININSFSF